MKDKNHWLVQWRRENERKRVLAEIIGTANAVRQTVLCGEKRVSAVVDSMEYDHEGAEGFIEFALLFARGHSIEEIADMLQTPRIVIRLISNNKLLRW